MNSGMYAALSGNMMAQQRLDVLTNNLANVNTAGFKRDRMVFESVLGTVKNPSPGTGTLTTAPVLSGASFATDYSAGPLKQTGNTLDLAIDGDGFFVVNTPDGKAYTRQGNFHLDAGSKLANADGFEVLANGGPVTITGGRVEIDGKGGVLVDGNQIASLDVVDFPKPYTLQKSGSVQFSPAGQEGDAQPARNPGIRQGFLEESNVNPLVEMAQLIETNRYYESCVKAVQSFDNMANKAANDLGRL
jgi:flagellar basal-body rod protein FlgF